MKHLLSCLFIVLSIIGIMNSAAFADDTQGAEEPLNFTINIDESIVVDQLLYHALQRIGYKMTMDASPMAYAIQMANSGERDALATQARGVEASFPNLCMVPEEICQVSFPAFVRDDSGLVLRSWNDLSGLVVGHLFQKTYIINHLPKDIAGFIQRETFYDLNLALAAGECDVIVTSSTLDNLLATLDGIVWSGTLDHIPSFTYLNKKYESLIPALSKSIVEMKADGTYDKIIQGEWHTLNHNPGVLHLSSYYPEDLWDSRIKEGIMSVLGSNDGISYYNVPLYSNRFRSEYEQAKNAYYSVRTLIMSNPPDVLIVSGNSALSFVSNNYSTLFYGIPVVLCDISGEIDYLWELNGNYTGIWETIPVAETATMIKTLYPQTTGLFVVNGYSTTGSAWRTAIERILGNRFNGMDVSYSRNLSFNDLLAEISALPENTAILLGYYAIDAYGLYFSNSQIDSFICSRTNLPVFGMRYGSIGIGQVGGKYIDPISQGAVAARIVLDIIADMRAGKTPTLPEPVFDTTDFNRWIFDESVVLSRSLNTKLLPSGADFVNHKLSLRESNPQAFKLMVIVGTLGTFLIVGLFIFVFTMQRKNRRLSEAQKSLHSAEDLKEAADSANKTKSAFLSRMSHEIRTPLGAITGMINIAISASDVKRKDYCLKRADSASKHLLSIVNDILDMSKIEADKFELSNSEFNLEKMLMTITNVANVRAEEKNLDLVVRLSEDIPMVMTGDELRLSQVITNLLTNAIKFTPENGTVILSLKKIDQTRDEVTIRIEVADTGIGISQEQRERLFMPFNQADTSISRTFGGTGLGLVISKRIVELMGGKIWIESEFGKGANFIFTIKVKTSKENDYTNYCINFNRENVRILAVDDSDETRTYFARVMKSHGLPCDVAASGTEALALIGKAGDKPYNIFFIDFHMPEMDGIELSRRIKEITDDNSIITMVSIADWNSIEKEAHAAGIKSFISKPLFPSMLIDTLNECFGAEKEGSSKDEETNKQGYNFTNYTLLVAEDVEINREIISGILEETRISIDYAMDGEKAVSIFIGNPDRYNLILMDINMPKMDGYEATKVIRSFPLKQAKDIPIIAMTANVFKEDIEKCLTSGMNGHIGKPINPDTLLDLLNKYLE